MERSGNPSIWKNKKEEEDEKKTAGVQLSRHSRMIDPQFSEMGHAAVSVVTGSS